jgi:hypothetical protein
MLTRLNGTTGWQAVAHREAGAQALPHDATLVVCLLACWQCREAVLPADLLRWAASGELPYLGMAEVVRGVRERAGGAHALPEQLVRPQGARPAGLLASRCSSLHPYTFLTLQPPSGADCSCVYH